MINDKSLCMPINIALSKVLTTSASGSVQLEWLMALYNSSRAFLSLLNRSLNTVSLYLRFIQGYVTLRNRYFSFCFLVFFKKLPFCINAERTKKTSTTFILTYFCSLLWEYVALKKQHSLLVERPMNLEYYTLAIDAINVLSIIKSHLGCY